ncbi:hypothetical protein Syun_022688 [Stephania yunnanensis]|uniref:Uncharacterized protein n=1 Tax=Stephania yunnanensis TaxID=152371 RepID=A0AAP0I1Q0_9MAGN
MVRQWKELLITPRGGATEGYSVAALVVVLLAFSLITGFIISMCADGASKGEPALMLVTALAVAVGVPQLDAAAEVVVEAVVVDEFNKRSKT